MLPNAQSPAPGMEDLRWAELEQAYRPDYARSLTGVFPTIFNILGEETPGYPHLLSLLGKDSPRKASRVLFLCLDAFGFKELELSHRFKGLYPDYGAWVTSVFPTITSCALSSIYQGLPPARHGMPGHVIYKDFPGDVVDMLKGKVPGAKATLKEAGFDTNHWKRESGILENGMGSGLTGYHLMDAQIVASGLSEVIYGKTRRIAFHDPMEGFTKAATILRDISRGWVSLYVPRVDTLSHVMTGNVPQMELVVRHLEDSIAWMASTLPASVLDDTALVVVADHGQNNIDRHLPLYGDNLAWLKANTKALGSSGRVMHVYLNGGDEAKVAAWLGDFVGEAGRVFTFDETRALTAPETYWQGASEADAAWLRQSLGDLVVVLKGGWNWERHDPDGTPHRDAPYQSRLRSQHGALTWEEIFVPLLVAPLAAILSE